MYTHRNMHTHTNPHAHARTHTHTHMTRRTLVSSLYESEIEQGAGSRLVHICKVLNPITSTLYRHRYWDKGSVYVNPDPAKGKTEQFYIVSEAPDQSMQQCSLTRESMCP